MISPAAMFIESAADNISSVPEWLRESQQKELTSFGDTRAQSLGASGVSDDFRKGYELGLQTARVILSGSATLAIAKVNARDIL